MTFGKIDARGRRVNAAGRVLCLDGRCHKPGVGRGVVGEWLCQWHLEGQLPPMGHPRDPGVTKRCIELLRAVDGFLLGVGRDPHPRDIRHDYAGRINYAVQTCRRRGLLEPGGRKRTHATLRLTDLGRRVLSDASINSSPWEACDVRHPSHCLSHGEWLEAAQ